MENNAFLKQFLLLPVFQVSTISLAVANFAEDMYELDLPKIVSASRLNQSVLQAPAAVTVIDSHMIEASGFNEFVDILRLVPGFQVGHYDSRLHTTVYHGLGWEFANHLQVLVDGRSTYNAGLSSVDWDALGVQLEDVDRIEVVRGPAASAYGSNSFVAAINIVTKAAELSDTFLFKAHSSSHSDRRMLLKYSDRNERAAYSITAMKRNDDGEKVADRNSHYQSHRDINELSIRSELTIKGQQLNSAVSFNRSNTSPFPIAALQNTDRTQEDRTLHLAWKYPFGSKELGVNYYYHAKDEDDIRYSLPLADFNFPEPLNSYLKSLPDSRVMSGYQDYTMYRSDLELQFSGSNQLHQYVVGVGGRSTKVKSELYLNGLGSLKENSYRMFANSQLIVTDQLLVNLGIIYEGSDCNDETMSPRASINWQPHQDHSVRLSYSVAYRQPTVSEKNMRSEIRLPNGMLLDNLIQGSNELDATKINSMDLGYVGALSQYPISWELKLYKDALTDYIDFVPYRGIADIDGTVNQLINSGDYTVYGFEGSLTYRPSLKSMVRFHFNRGHSNSEFIYRLNGTRTRKNDNYMPRESYGLLLCKEIHNWLLASGIYHVGQMDWAGMGEHVDHYTRYDISVGKTFKLANNDLQIRLLLQRLGGEHQEFNNDFEFNKEAFLQVTWIRY